MLFATNISVGFLPVAFVCGFLLALAGAGVAKRMRARRLDILERTIRDIATSGALEQCVAHVAVGGDNASHRSDAAARLVHIFNGVLQDVHERYAGRLQAERQDALSTLARQIAHDMRSPLAALDVAAECISALPEQHRHLIREAARRIRDIADNLLMPAQAPRCPARTLATGLKIPE